MVLSPEKKIVGLLAPLFALRTESDLGIGDVGALREFIDWAADHGFGLVQLLPVNETGNDHSPYNAISSVALDPTEADFAELLADVDLKALRAGPVHYSMVKAIKRRLLDRAFANFRFTP